MKYVASYVANLPTGSIMLTRGVIQYPVSVEAKVMLARNEKVCGTADSFMTALYPLQFYKGRQVGAYASMAYRQSPHHYSHRFMVWRRNRGRRIPTAHHDGYVQHETICDHQLRGKHSSLRSSANVHTRDDIESQIKHRCRHRRAERSTFQEMYGILNIRCHIIARVGHKGLAAERFHRFLNKSFMIVTKDRQQVNKDVVVSASHLAAYDWDSASIDGAGVIRSACIIGREFRFLFDFKYMPSPNVTANNAASVH
jgi:hypothetical protein